MTKEIPFLSFELILFTMFFLETGDTEFLQVCGMRVGRKQIIRIKTEALAAPYVGHFV